MTPSEAKLVVQKTKWTYQHGSGTIGPHLQAMRPEELAGAIKALGVDLRDVMALPATGGFELSIHGANVRLLAEAGAMFPERQKYVSGRDRALTE